MIENATDSIVGVRLYNQEGLNAPAYFIIPEGHPQFRNTVNPAFWEGGGRAYSIHHQYGCICNHTIEILGRIEEVPEPLATTAKQTLLCDAPAFSLNELRSRLLLDVEEVLGEALIRLKDGRYLATENCD